MFTIERQLDDLKQQEPRNLTNFECKFKVDLFFYTLRQNLTKIDKPEFNEKIVFLGCLLANNSFWDKYLPYSTDAV